MSLIGCVVCLVAAFFILLLLLFIAFTVREFSPSRRRFIADFKVKLVEYLAKHPKSFGADIRTDLNKVLNGKIKKYELYIFLYQFENEGIIVSKEIIQKINLGSETISTTRRIYSLPEPTDVKVV